MSVRTNAPSAVTHEIVAGLRGRDFLREADFTAAELTALIELAATLKADRAAGTERQRLVGKAIALIFEKTSTRTRAAFEVAAAHQGAATTFLDPTSSQLGHKETAADTAAVLGGMFDAIQFRGAAQVTVEELAAATEVPVYNGLTDLWHPTQMLADFLTMREHTRGSCDDAPESDVWPDVSLAYVGDARFNVGNSLLVTAAILGSDVRIVGPRSLWPSHDVQALARERAAVSGARILLTEDVAEGVAGVGFVHTDVWVSMGEPAEVWDERVEQLRPYRVDQALMAASGRPDTAFMHCLPAYHDARTDVGARVAARYGLTDGVEVSDEVFSSPATIAFQQAHNRMHTIKALMVATLSGG